jgi:uncharacterized damage-inducible protein DinB
MKIYVSVTDRLKSQHQTIAVLISGLAEERLLATSAPGKWSVHDQIAHLAAYQPVFIERINKIISSDHPSFGRYKAENDPEFERVRSQPTASLVQKIDADRQAIIALINGLSTSELGRRGNHPKFGDLTIVQWAEFFLLHEAHHIFSIFQLLNDVDMKGN